jgi:hypothetical protein
MARFANLLVDKHSGRTGSYGLVLENLLAAKGPNFHPAKKPEKGDKDKEKDGASGAGLASPSGQHSSVLQGNSGSVTSSAVLNKGEGHHGHGHSSVSVKVQGGGTNTHVSTASTENGRRHSHNHSRSGSPVN